MGIFSKKRNGLVDVTSDRQQTIIKSKTVFLLKKRKESDQFIMDDIKTDGCKNYGQAYWLYRNLVGFDKLPKSYAQQTLDGKIIGDVTAYDTSKNKEQYVELVYSAYIKWIESNPKVIVSNGNVDILSAIYVEFKLKSNDNKNHYSDVTYLGKDKKHHSTIHPDKIKAVIRNKLRRRNFVYHNKQYLTFSSIESVMDFVNNNYNK